MSENVQNKTLSSLTFYYIIQAFIFLICMWDGVIEFL